MTDKGHAPSPIRERDVTAAIRAARKADVRIARIEIDREGRIIIVPHDATQPPEPPNPWDEE